MKLIHSSRVARSPLERYTENKFTVELTGAEVILLAVVVGNSRGSVMVKENDIAGLLCDSLTDIVKKYLHGVNNLDEVIPNDRTGTTFM